MQETWGDAGKVSEPENTSAETTVRGEGREEKRNEEDVSEQTDGGLMDKETEFACRVTEQNGQHQQRTLLQMSPVALESEADIFVLPALSSPHCIEKKKKRQNPPPSARDYRREREGGAQTKCFTADVAALPQQPFPIQN